MIVTEELRQAIFNALSKEIVNTQTILDAILPFMSSHYSGEREAVIVENRMNAEIDAAKKCGRIMSPDEERYVYASYALRGALEEIRSLPQYSSHPGTR